MSARPEWAEDLVEEGPEEVAALLCENEVKSRSLAVSGRNAREIGEYFVLL